MNTSPGFKTHKRTFFIKSINGGVIGIMGLFAALSCSERQKELGLAELMPAVEDRMPDGSRYTSTTQTFLRGHHWLDRVSSLRLAATSDYRRGSLTLQDPSGTRSLRLLEVPFDQLLPRLHYTPTSPPDAFDAFNLMMAEYSRNGLSMPVGEEGDVIAHFTTTQDSIEPWRLDGDYSFQPNPDFRPYRVSVTNNCLGPGTWEISAGDRAGELYHGWFEVSPDLYIEMVARTNGLDRDFVASALSWRSERQPLALERLRIPGDSFGRVPVVVVNADRAIGYSSQGSRQKIARGFVRIEKDGQLELPSTRGDLTAFPVHLTSFVEPGKYSIRERQSFDLGFLADPGNAEIRRVQPLTRHAGRRIDTPADHAEALHLEIRIDLGSRFLLIGNLAVPLLVEQEELAIHGFGVGIKGANDLAERRALLIDHGPAPIYAFLAEASESESESFALNSHEIGLEQIFIRARPFAAQPHWEITLSSYERIVDLIQYRVAIPQPLLDSLADSSTHYISPLYFSYRDDNLR